MALKSSCFLILFLAFLVVDFSSALGKNGLFCNMCNSMIEGLETACREPESYSSHNCSSMLPNAKYCVIINGNLTIIDSLNLISQAIGPRRMCLIDLDRYEVEEKNIKPGCFRAFVDKPNYLAHKHFHFDGEICLCNDEDNCNSGDRWVPKNRNLIDENSASSFAAAKVFSSALVISAMLFF